MEGREKRDVKEGLSRLGLGFIRKLRSARAELSEMTKMAAKHGRCCPPCEIPKMADDFEGMVAQLDWYLDALVEAETMHTSKGEGSIK